MSVGQGNISFTTLPPQASPGGVTGARNGLSIDALLNAVLGQDIGEAGDPAALLNDREIPLDGNMIAFAGNDISFLIDDAIKTFQVVDNAANPFFNVDIANESYWLGDLNGVLSSTYFYLDPVGFDFGVNGVSRLGYDDGPKRTTIGGNFGTNGTRIDVNDDLADLFIDLAATNGVRTSDPGSGRGKWKLGQVQAGAVALDAANYVETEIDGVIVKLAIAV